MRGKPPSSYLRAIEDMVYLMQHFCTEDGGGLYANHVEISNCYWEFMLPKKNWDAIRLFDGFAEGGGGGGEYFLRLPFGWKNSPLLCYRVLLLCIKDLQKGQTLILCYLDDFRVLGFDKAFVAMVTASLVITLEDKGCLTSPKLI